jgi:membrane-associated protein
VLTTVPMALGPSWIHANTLLSDFGTHAALWIAALVIFAECGLLIGFFMPGDSLLFTVGLFIGRGDIHYPLWFACVVMTVAAFVGNVVGYEIGRVSGPAIFSRPNSRLFKQEYVDKTMQFFDDYGVRAIILARFVPVVRTFITVVAGVGRMDRRKYLLFSGVGALLWACGVTILGRLLGNFALIRDHIEVALLLVVLVSLLPALFEYLRHRGQSKRVATRADVEARVPDSPRRAARHASGD